MTKRISQAEHAQRWFAALNALDQHAAARAELSALGTPEHTVTALYGSIIDSVLAPLAQRYATAKCKPGARFTSWAEIFLEVNEISQCLADEERAIFYQELEDAKASPAFLELVESLRSLVHERRAFGNHSIRQQRELDAARTIWRAHWFMSHRTALTRRGQNRADKLMVWVGNNLAPVGFEPASA